MTATYQCDNAMQCCGTAHEPRLSGEFPARTVRTVPVHLPVIHAGSKAWPGSTGATSFATAPSQTMALGPCEMIQFLHSV